MRILIASLFTFSILAPAAYASDLASSQLSVQTTQAAASSHSVAGASSNSGAVSGSQARGGSAKSYSGDSTSGASSDNAVSGDNTDVNAWGFSYVDSAPQVPQATFSDGAVVTSQNLKVLGPIFGYAWQSLALTPSGLASTIALVQTASINDTTPAGRSLQASALAVICTYNPDLANARFGDDACSRIGEIVASSN